MTFNPNQKLVIDADAKSFLIACPFWANDLLNDLPAKKWDRSSRRWRVPILKQNIAAVATLSKLAGVQTTDAGKEALTKSDERIKEIGKRNDGFPSWYKFKTKPRKHQAQGLTKLGGLKVGALFMDMQTGKSKTAIDLTVMHRINGEVHGLLILVKRTLRRNWLLQLETHCPIPYSAHLPETANIDRFRRWMKSRPDFPVMIVGWESLSAGGMIDICHEFLDAMPKAAIIGDETTYITNYKSERTKRAIDLAHKCEYRYALTGTPALEGPMNLFTQFEFLDPNIIGIGDFLAYRNRYAVMGGFMKEVAPGRKVATEIVGYQHLDELMNLIAPYTFQVLKTEAYDLPPKRYEVRSVDSLTKYQRQVYDTIKKEGVLQVKKQEDRILQNVLEVALRLHQVTGGYAVKAREETRLDKEGNPKVKVIYEPIELVKPAENPKMIELMAKVEEFAKKKQGIVWAVYMPEILAIAKLLRSMGLRIGELHGGVPDSERQPMVAAFQRGDYDIVVGNASTGGMGYTMFASEVNIFYNNTFKAIDRVQAEDRAYGDGTTKSGVWVDIVAERTVDVGVRQALAQKQDLSDFVRHRIGEITRILDGEEV